MKSYKNPLIITLNHSVALTKNRYVSYKKTSVTYMTVEL